MSELKKCTACGCDLSESSETGLCARCLLNAGLEQHSEVKTLPPTQGNPSTSDSSFVPLTPAELSILIPHIEILELLGKGGMGAVYKGRQKSLDRLVAVKILPPEIGRDPAFSERFTREARALGKLNHPNIVAIHDSGHTNGLYYFVMEFIDGVTLRQLLKEKTMTPREVLAIVPQVCDALQFAHDEGIMHRDIKPENILIDKKGRVKIADFGLAKLIGKEQTGDNLTATHQVMGTIKYMSPEQMEGSKKIDHRADIYSLGVVFYELLTGEIPLGRFQPPSKKVQIDVRLDEIVLRALEREPEHRYQQVGEVKTEVETVVRTPQNGNPKAEPIPPKASKAMGEHWTFQWVRSKTQEIEKFISSSYSRNVILPLIGLSLFFYSLLLFSTKANGEDYIGVTVSLGFFYLVLHFLWQWRTKSGKLYNLPESPWSPEQIADQFHHSAKMMKRSVILTGLGLVFVLPFVPQPALVFLFTVVSGIIIWNGARALANYQDPGTLPIVLAMIPTTPAVLFGLPVALQILVKLAKPEVKSFIAYQTGDSSASEVTS